MASQRRCERAVRTLDPALDTTTKRTNRTAGRRNVRIEKQKKEEPSFFARQAILHASSMTYLQASPPKIFFNISRAFRRID
jgi:hypothetical protein